MDRYEVIRLLGKGGMGVVYEVVNRETGERLAMKTMRDAGARHLLRFKREFRVVAEFEHPNLVQLHDLGVEGDHWYFTMELIEGLGLLEALDLDSASSSAQESLPDPASMGASQEWANGVGRMLGRSGVGVEEGHRESGEDASSVTRGSVDFDSVNVTRGSADLDPVNVTRGSLAVDPEEEASSLQDTARLDASTRDLEGFKRLLAQVLDALEFLHSQGLVHRDLKPSNIMVDEQGDVKLLDFGLASHVERSQAISRTGMVVGTVAYMAPEQFTEEPVTAAADMYALGCIMFQILTGRLPLQGDPVQVLRARLHAPPSRVERHVRGLPTSMTDICHALMSREPAARPSIAAVREALGLEACDQASGFQGTGAYRALKLRDTVPFIGRVAELERIDACLTRALEGETQLMLIEGDPGIGKTALLERCVQREREKGGLCFRGRCFERERLPFAALDRAIDALIVTLSRWPRELIAPLQGLLVTLKETFPAMAMLIDDERSGRSSEPSARRLTREQQVSAICALLDHCQQEGPLLFALDDLQWSDGESLDLLQRALEQGVGRVCFLVALRSSQSPEPHSATHRLQTLARKHEQGARLKPGPLTFDESAQLIEAAGRGRLDAATIEVLSTRTEGNPSLALQLIDHVAQLDERARDSYLETLHRSGGVLQTLFDQLTSPAKRLLEFIALEPRPLDEMVLQTASDMEVATFHEALNELTRARLIHRAFVSDVGASRRGALAKRGLSSVEIEQESVSELVHEQLSVLSRRRRHRALALAMAEDSTRRIQSAESLVAHWQGAEAPEEARELALEVADVAEAARDFPRAARMLQRALEVPGGDPDPLTRAARWERLGRLCEFAALREQATDALKKALELRESLSPKQAQATDPTINLLRGRLAECLIFSGEVEEGLEVFERSMAASGLSPRFRSRAHIFVLLRLMVTIALVSVLPGRWIRRTRRESDVEQLEYYAIAMRITAPFWTQITAESALRCVHLALRTDDHRAIQRVLCVKTLALALGGKHTPGNVRRSAKDLYSAERLAREHDIPLGIESVMIYRAAHTALTDIDRSRALIEEAIMAIDGVGALNSHEARPGIGVMLLILSQQCDLDALLKLCEETIQSQHDTINLYFAYDLSVWAHCILGQVEDAKRLLDVSMPLYSRLPIGGLSHSRDTSAALYLLTKGDAEGALSSGDRAEEVWRAGGSHPRAQACGWWLGVMLEAALVLLRRGALPEWRRLQARRRARRLSRLRSFDHDCLGYRALALLREEEGKRAAARRALQRALDLSSQSNACPYRRWLCLEAAREMGRMTLDLESEARAIQAEGRFAPLPR